jgi:hypothetical protein
MMLDQIHAARLSGFITELRSGHWLQAQAVLREEDHEGKASYCCLGVASEIAASHGVCTREDDTYYSHDHDPDEDEGEANESDLLWAVYEWYGLPESNPKIKVLCGEIPDQASVTLCETCRRVGDRDVDCNNLVEVNATEVNDEMGLEFDLIADAFERTYLAAAGE